MRPAGTQQINALDTTRHEPNLHSPLTGKDKIQWIKLSVSYQPDKKTRTKQGRELVARAPV